MFAEVFGIIAGVLMLVSFAMPKQIYIRIIGAIGCSFFVAYGIMLGAWSLWILNSIMILINLYYIIKIIRKAKKTGEAATTLS